MDSFVKWFLIVCIILALLYYYGTKNYSYWKKKGVLQLRTIPFLGTNLFGILQTKNALQATDEIYSPFKGKRYDLEEELNGDGIRGSSDVLCNHIYALMRKQMKCPTEGMKDGQYDPAYIMERCKWVRNRKTDPAGVAGRYRRVRNVQNDPVCAISKKEVEKWLKALFLFGGIYMGQKAFLVVTDPDLLKQILVKDADSFLNRQDMSLGGDPLMSKNLVSLKDENWRKMRNVMTTVFTSAKMKDMFGFMDRCGRQAVEYLQEKVSEHAKSNPTGKPVYETEWKELFSRYGTDVIGSTAFGFEVNSFKNPDNEFYSSGLVIRRLFQGAMALKLFVLMNFPFVAKMIGMSFMGNKYNKFFISLVEDTIRERERRNIIRKDVIHVLMEARKGKGVDENGEPIKGKLPDLTDADIAAQALVFFFGGFETMATLLGFVAYELAVNPDIQEQLQREIDEVVEKENGMTYYGVVQEMRYLDMVISEALRKWPPATATDRAVTKTYTIPKTDTSPEVVLNEGDNIWVPILGLHYDAENFPNPHKFDPERFRDEKSTIKPFTYLPFGEGLRHCIGMRYALMETKVILVHLLRKFSFVPGKKTNIPMKLMKKGVFVVHPEDGFWLGITPRH